MMLMVRGCPRKSSIDRMVRVYAEKYGGAVIKGLFISVFYDIEGGANQKENFSPIKELPENCIWEIEKILSSDTPCTSPPTALSMNRKSARVSYKMTALKEGLKGQCRPFLVGDIERVPLTEVHVPYAAGFLAVHPGDNLTSIPDSSIKTFFSEDQLLTDSNFIERSTKTFTSYIHYLEVYVRKHKEFRLK